jgi:PAS domain S-box-containing protein
MNEQTNRSSSESYELYRNLMDNMLEGCQIIGHDWRYIYLNAAAELHNRRPNQELLGNLYFEMWPGIEATNVFSEIKCCMEERVASRLENRFVYPDGKIGWFNLSIQPVPDGVFILSVDIAEHKQAEEAHLASQRRFQALIENAPDGIALLGLDGKLRQVTPSSEHILGYSPGDVEGMDPAIVTHPDDLPALLALLNDLIQNPGKVIKADYRFRHADGSWRWLKSTISNLIGEPSVEAIVFNYRDITERKEAVDELRKSQETYQELFENNPHPMWVYETETLSFLMVNDAAIAQYGYERSEFLNMTIRDIRPPEELSPLAVHLSQTQQLQKHTGPWKHRKKDGTLIDVEIISHSLQFEGRPARLVLANDITERKRAEEEILSLARFPSENPNPVMRITRDGVLLFANSSSQPLLDLWRCKVGSNVPGSLQATISEVLQASSLKEIEFDCNGRLYTVMVAPIPGASYVNLYGRDITENRRAQEHIKYQATLIASVSDAIIASDMNGMITSWNPAAEEIYGWQAEEVTGNAINRFLQTEYQAKVSEAQVFQQFLRDGLWRGEVTQTRKDGTKIAIFSSVALVRDEVGAPTAMVAINRDITARKQAEEELQILNAELEQRVLARTAELNRSRSELEQANRAKDEFLANMSHELRTPLNSILGLSESLLEQRRGSLNEHQQKSLHVIESSGRHLLDLINDILDLSKIEAGKLDYYPEMIGVNEISQASLAFVKNQAMKKSIKLTYEADQMISRIYADPRRLKQILVNLLTNAVKFTPEQGHVILQVHADGGEHLVQFSVIDNGIGIAPEDLARLFQPFEQVDSQLGRQFEGTGLGLVLVKRLTDAHGGSVSVKSEVGIGSSFTINLPWVKESLVQQENINRGGNRSAQEEFKHPFTPAKQGVEQKRILLAEDNMANVLLIGEYLESYGYHVIVAHDGVEALEKAQEIDPDVILMDIQMPGMDGLETTRRLRAQKRFERTPIIALTALAMPGDRERCIQAGANEYMSKPVSLKSLVKIIEKK